MKTVVISGPGNLEIIEKPKPQPAPGEILVKVDYCGICGSDLHAFHTGFLQPDLTIGHEFSGVVAEVGPNCGNWFPGERVTGNNIIACGSCSFCLEGTENRCSDMCRLGITGPGAMAEYILLPARGLFKLPEHTPLEQAALAEPLSVGLHAINKVDPVAFENALVIGAGTIGLIVLTLLKQRGIKTLIVAEPNPDRAAVAKTMGATAIIDPGKGDPESEINRLTANRGASLVFECAGLPSTIQDACSLAAAGSPVVILSICYQTVGINFLSLVMREIEIKTAFGKTRAEFEEAVRLIGEGILDLTPLISRIIPLRSVKEGFLPSNRGDIKTLVAFSERNNT